MSDLPYIKQAQEVKITGQDSAGTTSNFVGADSSGNLFVKDIANGTDGAAAPTSVLHVGGKDGSGNLQSLLTDTTGSLVVSAKTALSPASPTTVSVGITSGVVVASNASRKGLVLTNTSNNIVSFGLGVAAVLNSGITLYPGGVWVFDEFTFTTGAINGIASVAASGVAIQEFS